MAVQALRMLEDSPEFRFFERTKKKMLSSFIEATLSTKMSTLPASRLTRPLIYRRKSSGLMAVPCKTPLHASPYKKMTSRSLAQYSPRPNQLIGKDHE